MQVLDVDAGLLQHLGGRSLRALHFNTLINYIINRNYKSECDILSERIGINVPYLYSSGVTPVTTIVICRLVHLSPHRWSSSAHSLFSQTYLSIYLSQLPMDSDRELRSRIRWIYGSVYIYKGGGGHWAGKARREGEWGGWLSPGGGGMRLSSSDVAWGGRWWWLD